MAMTPCSNPRRCGVTSHVAGSSAARSCASGRPSGRAATAIPPTPVAATSTPDQPSVSDLPMKDLLEAPYDRAIDSARRRVLLAERDRRLAEAQRTAMEHQVDPRLSAGDQVRVPRGTLGAGSIIEVTSAERNSRGILIVKGTDGRGREAVFGFPGVDREGNPVTELDVVRRAQR